MKKIINTTFRKQKWKPKDCFVFGDSFTRMIFMFEGFEKSSQKTREKIIILIKENSSITLQELSDILGISVKGIEWQITKLKKLGIIKRIGPDKGGYREVNDK